MGLPEACGRAWDSMYTNELGSTLKATVADLIARVVCFSRVKVLILYFKKNLAMRGQTVQ